MLYTFDTELQHHWYTGKERVELGVKRLQQDLGADQSSEDPQPPSFNIRTWIRV